jgi:hypothetical protein
MSVKSVVVAPIAPTIVEMYPAIDLAVPASDAISARVANHCAFGFVPDEDVGAVAKSSSSRIGPDEMAEVLVSIPLDDVSDADGGLASSPQLMLIERKQPKVVTTAILVILFSPYVRLARRRNR